MEYSRSDQIEHSENKVNTYFENEVGPEELQSSIQETYNLQNFRTTRTESKHNQLLVVCAFDILAVLVFVKGYIGAL